MTAVGINIGYLALQLCFIAIPLATIAILIAAVMRLRDMPDMDGTQKLLWVLIIVVAPIIGAVAFFVLNPKEKPGKTYDFEP